MNADNIEAYLRLLGAQELTAEEKRTAEYREQHRAFLRILANDDTSIPVPNEEAELDRECGPVSGQLPGGIIRTVPGK